MAKSIRSHKKKRFRSLKRKNVFEPLYSARVERLSSRLKNLSSKDIDDSDEMTIDNDQKVNTNNHVEDTTDMNMDLIPTLLDNTGSNDINIHAKSSYTSLKKKILRKNKLHTKKRSFGTVFSKLPKKKKSKR
ncbi:hypothetical protein PORY_002661 [Pneumocystis oryctolagi]|uniref:Uncharacterized protein n=1 Tax=Pneumocystis oryctolagi TaxID=42067 RepID=A0ACB7C8D0_9ASCO|nr:hypothetical protein PORY_002661 [Pneumocystis oryctolagi]